MTANTTRVAVLGAGLIGIDLLDKIQRSPVLECHLVVGRDRQSLGLRRAAQMGCEITAGGIDALIELGPFDVVFDASNATAHTEHSVRLAGTDTVLIDLTPTLLGAMVVPTIDGDQAAAHRHLNLISCGAQASIPLLHALARRYTPAYIEVVSTAASASAGRATRLNLDEYIATTSSAIATYTGAEQVKVLANLSPARPEPPFRVTMTLLTPSVCPRPADAEKIVQAIAQQVRAYAPGFVVTSVSTYNDQISLTAEISSQSRRLPHYAGNLDIINAAAVLMAEQHAATPTSAL